MSTRAQSASHKRGEYRVQSTEYSGKNRNSSQQSNTQYPVRSTQYGSAKKRTEELIRKDRRFLWHPFTQMKDWQLENFPIIEKGKGSYLIDTDGKRYLDGASSLWCNLFGHQRNELDKALLRQSKKIAHSTFLGLSHESAIQLSEELVRITPKNLTRVFYSDSGSEAVEIALKMAFQYWQQNGFSQRKMFVTLGEAYHGDTIGSVSLGGMDLFHKKYKPLLFKTYKVPVPSLYHRGKGMTQAAFTKKAITELEQAVKKHHKSLAAIVMEPLMQGAAGMIQHPVGYLKAARRLANQYGIFLILDEVATGFGRTGKMFACEHEGVRPDILCVAKGLTGGYLPLAATLATEKIYKGFLGNADDFKTFYHGHTYTANPMASAVALETLNIFKRDKIIQGLSKKINFVRKGLEAFKKLSCVGDIRQVGLMVGIELVKNKKTGASFSAKEKVGHKVILEARKQGVIIRPLGDVIVLMPLLSMNQKELKQLLSVTYEAIAKVTGAFFFHSEPGAKFR